MKSRQRAVAVVRREEARGAVNKTSRSKKRIEKGRQDAVNQRSIERSGAQDVRRAVRRVGRGRGRRREERRERAKKQKSTEKSERAAGCVNHPHKVSTGCKANNLQKEN